MGFLVSKTPKPPELPPAPPPVPKMTDKAVLDVRDLARRRAAVQNQYRPVLSGEMTEPAQAKKLVLGG